MPGINKEQQYYQRDDSFTGTSNFQSSELRQLIPSEVQSMAGIHGEVRMVTSRENEDEINFVVYDEVTIKRENLLQELTFLDDDELECFPDLFVNDDEIRRPLFYGAFSFEEVCGVPTLFSRAFEVSTSLQGKGIGTAYQKKLENFAFSQGCKAILGCHHSMKTAQFFVHQGRRFLFETSDEFRKNVRQFSQQERLDENSIFTVKFITADASRRFLNLDCNSMVIEEKMLLAQKIQCVHEILGKMSKVAEGLDMLVVHEEGLRVARYALSWLQLFNEFLGEEKKIVFEASLDNLDEMEYGDRRIAAFHIVNQFLDTIEHIRNYQREVAETMELDELTALIQYVRY